MGFSQSFVTEWDDKPKTIMSPIDRQLTKELAIEYFHKLTQHQIPSLDDFNWACKEAAKILRELPNLVTLTVESNDRIILVGDTHGCFEAFINMFVGNEQTQRKPLGFPGDKVNDYRNVYLINGDMVDRGGSGYQIIFTLCLFIIVDPKTMYVNRGNHESASFGMADDGIGGKFMSEIAKKFPNEPALKYKPAIWDLFCSLPICHLIDQNIFVVHGGVPRANDLTGVKDEQQYPMNGLPSVQYTGSITPYELLPTIQNLNPPRFQTTDFIDNAKQTNLLWHQFLWSYDRLPYAATFMEFNNIKTMVNSHTATPYHNISTFLPADNNERYEKHSVITDDSQMHKVKQFFEENPDLNNQKRSIMEIFSSPTNNGRLFAAVINAKFGSIGSRLDYDPLNWIYYEIGGCQEFPYVKADK